AWDPSPREIEEFEAVVESELERKHPPKYPNLVRRIRQYHRQYLGVLKDRRRVIVVEMCCEVPPDWPKTLCSLPSDGGPCYVTVEYDPATSKVLFVRVSQRE